MTAYDSTQVLGLLGKTVSLTEQWGGIANSVTGVVMAVIVVSPGADVSTSILVGDSCQSEYFALEDIVLTVH